MQKDPTKAKKSGRPRKVRGPLEQLHQLTVRVPAVLRTAIELVGRDMGVSTNEALVVLLNRAARQYVLDGKPSLSIGESIEEMASGKVIPNVLNCHDGRKYSDIEKAEIWGRFEQLIGLYRAVATPESLRTAEQRYLLEVFAPDGPGYWNHPEILRELLDQGFKEGRPASEVAAEWRRRALEAISSDTDGQ